jgi:uncharacterized protein YjbI with pentapeptide repeats
MFTPIHLLPQPSSHDYRNYKERWNTPEGRDLQSKILQLVKNGAGEDFLESDFQNGNLGFLEDEGDLRGFRFFQQDFNFPARDTFAGIDFSYAEFYHTKMANAVFACTIRFAKIYNCTFERCTFASSSFFASTLEKVKFIDCDFEGRHLFTNCSFAHTTFQNTFFSDRAFSDCSFDANTNFTALPRNGVAGALRNLCLTNATLSDVYQGISEAYFSGGTQTKGRDFLFLQLHFAARFNTEGTAKKLAAYFWEYISGFGLRPSRVLLSLVLYFILLLLLFSFKVSFPDAILLTCGSIFTFGAKSDMLDSFSLFFSLLYAFSSFVGISLTALFVTVLVNVSFRGK